MITIHYKIGLVDYELEVESSEQDYTLSSIMQAKELHITFAKAQYIELPTKTTYIDFEGERFYLLEPANIRKLNSENFQYTLKLENEAGKLKHWMFKNEGKIKFTYTASLWRFLELIIENCQEREFDWTIGYAPDEATKTISFNSNTIFEALGIIAEEFDTEFRVREDKTIFIERHENDQDEVTTLAYGQGYGVKPIIERRNQDKNDIKRLYIQGGDKNIDSRPDEYGNKYLLLPNNQVIYFDGYQFRDVPFEGAKGYRASTDGTYITIDGSVSADAKEDSIDLSHIYPKRVGVVSDFTISPNPNEPENPFYNIHDNSIPNELDYNDVQLIGEKMTMTFQTGYLAGRTFDIAEYVHSSRTFKLVSLAEDGQVLPNSTFEPSSGDEYVIFGCTLPDAYIRNDANMSGASWELFEEGVRALYEREEMSVIFSLPIDELWYKDQSESIETGDYILFNDPDIVGSNTKIRVIAKKTYVNHPKRIEITLSNARATRGIRGLLDHLSNLGSSLDHLQRDVSNEFGRVGTTIRGVSKEIEGVEVLTLELSEETKLRLKGINTKNKIIMQMVDAKHRSVLGYFVDGKENLNPVLPDLEVVDGLLNLSKDAMFNIFGSDSPRVLKAGQKVLVQDEVNYIYADMRNESTQGYGEAVIRDSFVDIEEMYLIGYINPLREGFEEFEAVYIGDKVKPAEVAKRFPPIRITDRMSFVEKQHNLGYNPNVKVVLDNGDVVEVSIFHPSLDSIELSWVGEFNGYAYLD